MAKNTIGALPQKISNTSHCYVLETVNEANIRPTSNVTRGSSDLTLQTSDPRKLW